MSNSFFSSNSVMAGGYIPRPVSDHLSLLALHRGMSRANVIELLVVDYLSDKPIEDLINSLAHKIFESWRTQKVRKTAVTFASYLDKEVKSRLRRRRIAEDHITKILKRVGDLNVANERTSKGRTK